MNVEENRLRTFATWPADARVEAKKIAKAGFFYTGNNFDVKCFCCDGIIGDWEYGDSAITRHGRLNTLCKFVMDPTKSGNIPYVPTARPTANLIVSVDTPTNLNAETNTQTTQNDDAVIPITAEAETNIETSFQSDEVGIDENFRYSSLSARLASFDGWPDNISQTPTALSIAGFYYTGVGDFVRCFECDGGLRGWLPDDDPWAEHARCFPTCPFLQRLISINNNRNNAADVETAMMNETTRAALDIGIDARNVREAIRRQIVQTGSSFSNTDELINTSLELAGTTAGTQRQHTPIIARAAIPLATENIPLPLSTEDENRRLREARLCKICLDSELAIVFLPCGHFAACETCAMNLTQCPLCRATIDANVRTFLS